jgi:hypothetical protein
MSKIQSTIAENNIRGTVDRSQQSEKHHLRTKMGNSFTVHRFDPATPGSPETGIKKQSVRYKTDGPESSPVYKHSRNPS